MSSLLLPRTPPPTVAAAPPFLSPRTHIPPHVYKHPAAILLELCTSMKELQQFLPLIIKNGLYNEHLFQTKLVSLFCKFGSLNDAVKVFEPIESKIDPLYHTILKGYAQQSNLDAALKFFCRMKYDGVAQGMEIPIQTSCFLRWTGGFTKLCNPIHPCPSLIELVAKIGGAQLDLIQMQSHLTLQHEIRKSLSLSLVYAIRIILQKKIQHKG
ncbi:Pentatricopeptide repeat-containing protein, chloroplastic [Sesamum alatum]|uniref:Pentatricopeptide repeat-containing protein, chloroplastic n=1 Tax=Sesamum alatum TaxID=300844 RepID=A0AAE2CA06_9LAMI|nr:Pentatricopeptide repeat-containing protein, chloroplastic [Sesamum alatum]